MDTSNAERLEADRAILRQSVSQIAADVGIALRGAVLEYPVFVTVPHGGDALAVIITSVDPPHTACDEEWSERMVA